MIGFGHFPELVMVLVFALLIFGPKRLPQVGEGLGKSLREFRKATSGVQDIAREALEPLQDFARETMAPLPPPRQHAVPRSRRAALPCGGGRRASRPGRP
jgi:TatA/E family protein of Tat protein translocase